MFDFESKLLQFLRAYLVALFLFIVRFDGQGVHFLWRYLAKRLGYVVVLVKILDWEEIRGMLAILGSPQKVSYDFAQKQDVLASNQEYAAYDISVDFVNEDALDRILQDQIGCEIEGTAVQCMYPHFSRLQSVPN